MELVSVIELLLQMKLHSNNTDSEKIRQNGIPELATKNFKADRTIHSVIMYNIVQEPQCCTSECALYVVK